MYGQDLALVDPHLHADATKRGARLGEPVVDVGAQRVQRHPSLAVALAPAHLGAAEATAALHLDALRAGLHRGLQRALHGAPEADAPGELVGDTLREQRGVELRLLDLLDVEGDLGVAGDLVQALAQTVGLGALAADDDAGARGVHVDRRRSRVRSISTRLTAARSSSLRRYSRILVSSVRKSRYSLPLAIQRDFQSVTMPSRNPYGLTL